MDEIELENGEARVETDGLTVEEQVRRAYADGMPQRDNDEYKHDQRCLSFLTDRWLDPEEAKNLVRYIGPYNAFDPDTVAEKIRSVAEHVEFLRVAIGREGSPALYFEVNPEGRTQLTHAFESYADEFMDCEAPDISGKEMYRSEDSHVDEHSMCSHESPPNPPGREADGSPEANREYVRAWWD